MWKSQKKRCFFNLESSDDWLIQPHRSVQRRPSWTIRQKNRDLQGSDGLRLTISIGESRGCKNLRLLSSGYDCYIAMVKPWPIEIDGLPINSMVIFHGYIC